MQETLVWSSPVICLFGILLVLIWRGLPGSDSDVIATLSAARDELESRRIENDQLRLRCADLELKLAAANLEASRAECKDYLKKFQLTRDQ